MLPPEDPSHADLDAQRIERQQRRLLDFARASGDWLWECDAALRMVWISEGYEAQTGESPAALIGAPIDDAPLLDVHGEPLSGRLHEVMRRREPFSRVLTEMVTAGGRRFVSRSAVPVFDEAQRLVGWRGTARDLSVRVNELRRALSRSAMLDKLAAQMPGAIYQYRIDAQGHGGFPYLSEGLRRVFGLGADEVRAEAGLLFDRVHADDRRRMRAATAVSRQQLSPWRVEFRYLHPDGRWRWIQAHSQPERLADGGMVWHGYGIDVTQTRDAQAALRQSEERWALAAEAAGIGLAHLDLADGRLHFDAQACRNHGMSYPQDGFTLDAWLAQIVPEDRDEAAGRMAEALQSRHTVEARYRITAPGGARRWLEVVARARDGADGQEGMLVATCRDVTAQRETEQLKRERDAAELASHAKSEMLSRLSHELRTPLNGIVGFAQLMALDAEQPLGAAQMRRLEGVQRAGRHLLGLVNDVLDLSRLEQGRFELRMRAVDLLRVLEASLAMVQPLAVAHGVSLPHTLPEGPCWVQADARALEQVLLNLLSNAIKFNRRGGAVRLDLQGGGQRAELLVCDEGPGLSESEQRELFQPFTRLGVARSSSEGSGLGLVIARQLAQAMGGTLTLRSAGGTGSCFVVELARSERESGDSGPGTLFAALPGAVEPASTDYRVVYIEDEPLNALLMEEVFRGHAGWQLDVARNGGDGLALVRAQQPDLVMVDMNLPDMNGLQIVQALRADSATAGLHCVALSADAMPEQIAAARAAGFDDYWTKPIDVPHMLGTIARAIEERRARA